MPAYHYAAMNRHGQETKGVIEADSEKHARQLLRAQSLLPVKVKPVKEKKLAAKRAFQFSFSNTLSKKELALITRQLATLLTAGLPLEEALLAVAEQTERQFTKGLIFSVRAKVLEGHALASALSENPDAFSGLYIATVAAGEKSGHLDKVLLRLADYTEQQWHLQQKLRTALIYPVMIILVALGIVGFLLQYVVPKMIAVYGNLNQALPILTVILIGISHFFKTYGLYLFLILIIAAYFLRRLIKKNSAFRLKVHYFLLKLPLIGHALKTADTARFSRTLSILSGSGVPILEAMTIAAQLITIIPIRQSVEQAVHRVREGSAIYLALKQTNFFPPMNIHMMASGEASGQLESMLDRVANSQENEIIRLIDVSLALFEPAIILVMGAIVLFIVLAVLLPIFQLNQFTG
jgi:general secretion pathway protein F